SLFTSKTSNEVEATVDTTLKEQIIKLNTKLSSKSEKQHHYIEILEKFIKIWKVVGNKHLRHCEINLGNNCASLRLAILQIKLFNELCFGILCKGVRD
ncbi:17476_t:CDS:2, partial [Entrophospora sp. SA101]